MKWQPLLLGSQPASSLGRTSELKFTAQCETCERPTRWMPCGSWWRNFSSLIEPRPSWQRLSSSKVLYTAFKSASKMSCKHLKTMRHMFSYVFMVCSLLSSVWRGVFIGCFLFALQGRKQLGSIHLLTELTRRLVVCKKPCRLLRQGMVEDGVAYELLLRHAAAALRREAKVRTCCWHLQSFRRKWSWKDSEQVSRMWYHARAPKGSSFSFSQQTALTETAK